MKSQQLSGLSDRQHVPPFSQLVGLGVVLGLVAFSIGAVVVVVVVDGVIIVRGVVTCAKPLCATKIITVAITIFVVILTVIVPSIYKKKIQ